QHATLAERVLDPACHAYLAHLAAEPVAARQVLRKHVPRELHRDRAEAFVERERARVVPDGAGDAAYVDATVLPEATVLDRDEAVAHERGDVIESEERTALRREVGQPRAVHR